MEKLTTKPYLPAEGREFLEYMQHLLPEMDRLQREGRIPGDHGVDDLLAFWRLVTAHVRVDVDRAGPTSVTPITTSFAMTEAEHQRIWSMFDTLYPLLEILEMRGAVNLERTEGMTRVILALYQGSLG